MNTVSVNAMKKDYDVVVLGAGASGVFCAGEILQKSYGGVSVLVLDKSSEPLRKVKASGGGRCNFTNTGAKSEMYQSIGGNDKFVISALKQYPSIEFIDEFVAFGGSWNEKHKGQLFADGKSGQVIDFLKSRCESDYGKVDFKLGCEIVSVNKADDGFVVETSIGSVKTKKIVVALGGPSFDKIGGTGFGAKVAKGFGHKVEAFEPALVGLKSSVDDLRKFECLAGTAMDVSISVLDCGGKVVRKGFNDALLFTHKGVSGPAVMQASLFIEDGASIVVDFIPVVSDLLVEMKKLRAENPSVKLEKYFMELLPKKFVSRVLGFMKIDDALDFGNCSDKLMAELISYFKEFKYTPAGNMGFNMAEVSRGGVSLEEVSSKSMESQIVDGLYFVGEVLDVAGCLGGYNLQWAWSSGFVCAKDILTKV